MYDDLLKRYQEAGTEFLDAARTRAEELFRDLQRIGESTQSRVEDSRRNTDVVVELIRRELATQLNQLGTATRSELGRIFDTLETMAKTAAANAPGTKKPAPSEKVAATTKAVEPRKAPASKKVPAAKKASATKKAAPKTSAAPTKAAATKKAPATKKLPVTKAAPTKKATATKKAVAAKASSAKVPGAKKAPAPKKAAATVKAAPAASD